MLIKLRTLIIAIVGIGLLAGAAYLAVSLMSSGSSFGLLQLPGLAGTTKGGKTRQSYEVIPPPEVPQTQPDVVGPVVQVKDQSLMVVPMTKGPANQNVPASEVVITGATKVYQDVTKLDGAGPIPLTNGKIQQRVAPYDARFIKVGDTVIVWGDKRADRLVAQALIVEVANASAATATP